MHIMERSRSEGRIDELSIRVGRGFTEVDRCFGEVDRRLDKVDRHLEKIDERFEGVGREFVAVRREMKEGFENQQRLLLQGIVGICASIVAGFGAVAGVLAAVV